MDAVLFITLAVVLVFMQYNKPEETDEFDKIKSEDITREARLNESYYEDPNAFCEIANALGFPKEAS